MYCKKCGEQMTEGAEFCVHCGSETGESNGGVTVKKRNKIIPIIIAVILFGSGILIAFTFLNSNKTIMPKGLVFGMSKEEVLTEYPDAIRNGGALEIVGDGKTLNLESNSAEMKYFCFFDDYDGLSGICLESSDIGNDSPSRTVLNYIDSLYGDSELKSLDGARAWQWETEDIFISITSGVSVVFIAPNKY